MPLPHYFITGTDTDVGKTWVGCAMLKHLATRYPRVVGMKPVAAGTLGAQVHGDCVALRAASTLRVSPELDNPYCFAAPISPHLAARAQGQHIEIDHIVTCYHQLAQQADAVVVEGAGGFLVPLTETQTGADLAQRLGLPILLVVGLRLGCLNHALLTATAIKARGLKLAGWVANRIDPQMLAAHENIATLVQHLPAPLWADVAYGASEIKWITDIPVS